MWRGSRGFARRARRVARPMLPMDHMTRARSKPPWEQAPPRATRPAKLSPKEKKQAAARARLAGRRYPNLVDNRRAAAGGLAR